MLSKSSRLRSNIGKFLILRRASVLAVIAEDGGGGVIELKAGALREIKSKTSHRFPRPYRPSRRRFQRQTDKRTTKAPASGQTCAHFLILHLTCQLSRAPNQQKVAKDAPPKVDSQGRIIDAVHEHVRWPEHVRPVSMSTVNPASMQSAANSSRRSLCRALLIARAWSFGPKAGFGRPSPARPGRCTARLDPARPGKPGSGPGRPGFLLRLPDVCFFFLIIIFVRPKTRFFPPGAFGARFIIPQKTPG